MVDVQAWGHEVTTSGYGSLQGGMREENRGSFTYPPEMSKTFKSTSTFVPSDHTKDRQIVREVAAAGETYTRKGLSKIK